MSRPKIGAGSRGSKYNDEVIYSAVNKKAQSIRAAGIEPAPGLIRDIAAYCELLLRWNRKISLTTITDPAEMVERNFVESFYGAHWLEKGEGVLCDVGSGAGFPGLALKLVRPRWTVRLFEPNLKKAAFLSEVVRGLESTGVEVVRERWQEASVSPNSVDIVTARAVGDYDKIAHKARLTLREGGRLLLWVGISDGEWLRKMDGWHWEWEQIPGSQARILLTGAPKR